MVGRESVTVCQEEAVALMLVRAEALVDVVSVVDVVVGAGFVLGVAPYFVAAVDARGDETGVGQVHCARSASSHRGVVTCRQRQHHKDGRRRVTYALLPAMPLLLAIAALLAYS